MRSLTPRASDMSISCDDHGDTLGCHGPLAPDEGDRGRGLTTALGPLARITPAAITAVTRQNSPTHGKPPRASITPPSEAPPTTPSWLLTAKSPVAVARDGPASSVSSTAVTGQDKG